MRKILDFFVSLLMGMLIVVFSLIGLAFTVLVILTFIVVLPPFAVIVLVGLGVYLLIDLLM